MIDIQKVRKIGIKKDINSVRQTDKNKETQIDRLTKRQKD